jgi:hypothetical protein
MIAALLGLSTCNRAASRPAANSSAGKARCLPMTKRARKSAVTAQAPAPRHESGRGTAWRVPSPTIRPRMRIRGRKPSSPGVHDLRASAIGITPCCAG